jgi:hypothetical protein
MDRHESDAGVEQPVDDDPVRLFDRDPRHLQLAKAADERLDPVLGVHDTPFLDPAPASVLLGHLDLGDQAAGRRIPPRELDPGCLADQAAPAVAPDEIGRP